MDPTTTHCQPTGPVLFDNGQGCCLVKRVYAPESRYDELVEALAAIAGQITVGNPVEPPNVPFGGHRWSGFGVENGPWGLSSFTDIQGHPPQPRRRHHHRRPLRCLVKREEIEHG